MNILSRHEPVFKRMTASLRLYFARRKMKEQADQIADLQHFLVDYKRRYEGMENYCNQQSSSLEALHTMGVRQLDDGRWYFDFPILLPHFTADDKSDIEMALMDSREYKSRRFRKAGDG